jgi:archaellum component FlaG (FlaF/FlaG flagellin family)
MEDPLLKKRISTPRAATVVVLAAVVATSVTVVPSVAQSFLTSQKAAKTYLSNQKAAKTYLSNAKASLLYLKKKAASNLYLAKATSAQAPVAAIAAGTAQFGPTNATTAGYIPTAFTSFATKATNSNAVISFSGTASCYVEKPGASPTVEQACPVQILVDGQTTGKVNFAPATANSAKGPAALVHTIVQTSVLGKGGHTVSVQYAGAAGVVFTLKSWNLAVETYPQPEEVLPATTAPTTGTPPTK